LKGKALHMKAIKKSELSRRTRGNITTRAAPPLPRCVTAHGGAEETPTDGAEKEAPVAASDVTRLTPPSPHTRHRPRAPYGWDSLCASLQQRGRTRYRASVPKGSAHLQGNLVEK